MSRVNNDVAGLQNVVTDTVASSINNFIITLSTLVAMIFLDWRLTALSVLILPLFIVPTKRVGRLNFEARKLTQQKLSDLSSLMQETLSVSGVMLVKAFTRQTHESRRFDQTNRKLMRLQVRQAMIGRWFFMFMGFLSTAGPAIIYWYGGREVIGHSLSIGTVVAFTALLQRLFGPVSALTNIQVNVAGSIALFHRLFEYLDLPIEIQNRPHAIELGDVKGHIELDHVSFSYRADQPVLKQVQLEIQPGQTLAIVGPSGSGKSTIAQLIPRFYDPTGGSIRIDGIDLRDIQLESLGQAIGIVAQETYLFHASIRENLLYGKPNATQEEMEGAAKAANIHDVIMNLPEGYDTIVGERGYKLSGGEKQRIAIARVILKNPRILLLDEATSALDAQSEALVQNALDHVMKSRTNVVIAHRLSTIMHADQIVVIDQGQALEKGTHLELLKANGLYAALYQKQMRINEEESGHGI